jgi:hypothetical protein
MDSAVKRTWRTLSAYAADREYWSQAVPPASTTVDEATGWYAKRLARLCCAHLHQLDLTHTSTTSSSHPHCPLVCASLSVYDLAYAESRRPSLYAVFTLSRAWRNALENYRRMSPPKLTSCEMDSCKHLTKSKGQRISLKRRERSRVTTSCHVRCKAWYQRNLRVRAKQARTS